MKIGIIGMGHVGSTLAYTLCLQGLADELILIDKNEAKVQAEYLELKDVLLNISKDVRLVKNDYGELSNAQILIFCAGDISILENATDRFAEMKVSKEVVDDVAPKIKESGFNGFIISITNPCDLIVHYLADSLSFDKQKIVGSGTLIDSNRLINRSLRADSMVIGEHGESQVALNASKAEARLAAQTGWEIYSAKRHTAFGIASSVARIITALVEESEESLLVSSYDAKRDCFYGSPSNISLERGVLRKTNPDLSIQEAEKFAASLEKIQSGYLKLRQ
ncbi:hypothetical protein OZX68_06190 [Streptococcaceae bacterium ESL0729]|nr:hypothetical protein OZX68_06190 [Streptococcaceae bacterium ESL0729]